MSYFFSCHVLRRDANVTAQRTLIVRMSTGLFCRKLKFNFLQIGLVLLHKSRLSVLAPAVCRIRYTWLL